MLFTKEQQLLNFRVFDETFVSPALDLYGRSQAMTGYVRALHFADASLLESLCWVTLGRSVGYFAETELQKLIGRINLSIAQKYISERGYLFDLYWLVTLDEIRNESTPRVYAEFDPTEDLTRLFQSCLIRAVQFSRQPNAQASIMILDFDRPGDIEQLIQLSPSFESITQALKHRAGVEKSGFIRAETMYAGFAMMVHYLDAFRSAYYSQIAIGRLESASNLFRRIAQLQTWRFYFIAGSSLTTLQDEFLASYFKSMEIISPEHQLHYRKFLKDLTLFWSGLQTPKAAAGGGN